MIQTIRDAEMQIEALKRQQNELIKELRSLNLSKNGKSASDVQIVRQVEVDSQLTADQNTVIHKLLHLFNNLQVKNIETDNLETDHLEVIGPIPQVHIGEIDSDQGIYIMNIGANLYLSVGTYFNGTNWIAVNSTSNIMIFQAGGVQFFSNTGLTVGQIISVNPIFTFDSSGITFISQPLSITYGGTGATTAPVARTNLDVYSKAETDAKISERDIQIVNLSTNYNLTTTNTLVPGIQLTTTKTGLYTITVTADVNGVGAGDFGTLVFIFLNINGVDQAHLILPAVMPESGVTDRLYATQQWLFVLNIGDVIRLSAQKNTGTGTSFISAINTTMLIRWDH